MGWPPRAGTGHPVREQKGLLVPGESAAAASPSAAGAASSGRESILPGGEQSGWLPAGLGVPGTNKDYALSNLTEKNKREIKKESGVALESKM